MRIRPAKLSDLGVLCEIRNHYIAHSNALFETVLETVEGRTPWFQRYSTQGPHRILVAEQEGSVVGYVSSSKYRDGEFFSKTVELSVFVDAKVQAKGIGTSLYSAIFKILEDEKIHCVLAGVALPNDASVALHKKFGMEEVGVFREYAIKNGQYFSSMWLQKRLGT